MQNLKIENFGAIKKADLNLKDVNIFIGKNAKGKSTIAKVISILSKESFNDYDEFKQEFKDKNINFFEKKTILELKKDGKNTLDFGYECLELINISVYIPSERSFISLVSNSLFNMIRYDIPIPKFILDFGAEFERALQSTKELKIEFLDITYKFESGEHRIYHSKKEFVKLSESASAIQTLIPMLLTIKYISTQNTKKIFVIEEPELNLYPIAQKGLVEFLVKECLQNGSKLIVTTHSPYILTAFNNLIQASNTVNAKPNLGKKVEEIISKDKWLNYNRVGSWYVDNGVADDIMDYENNIIGANKIDDVSETLGSEFDELIELMYGEE